MYSTVKKALYYLLPKRFILRSEFLLRRLFSVFYRGRIVKCVLCSGSFSRFITLQSGDLLCPRCGSLPRHRRLWLILQQNDWLKTGIKILHFSPSRILQHKMNRFFSEGYSTTDYDRNAHTDKHYDITDVPEKDGCFDLIICFHVLEHIPDDRKAIRELYRILKPGGTVLIQTPFKEGDIYENNNISDPAGRLQHFGQEDHVRLYSAEGLRERLQKAGFSVYIDHFNAEPVLGLKDEIVLNCKKTT
ncbi:MAG: methyltransferase domain-containing protein [Bacteroidales bacterium]|nr:methyltransferase domain-containing protein [Bacteroidales bacterium]MBN2763369.1 methyltransferase domain-containing protein [Bacteroidales bacterium]